MKDNSEKFDSKDNGDSSTPAPGKKKYDYITKVNYLFREARFFLMKSNNEDNINLSKSKGVWSTPPQNEAKLNQAVKECRNVILVYSVKESGKFCGMFILCLLFINVLINFEIRFKTLYIEAYFPWIPWRKAASSVVCSSYVFLSFYKCFD